MKKRFVVLSLVLLLLVLFIGAHFILINWSLWFAASTGRLETSLGETMMVPTSSLIDVKVNGNDGPVKLKAPATYSVKWVIDPKLTGADCNLTGYSEELVRSISGSGEISVKVVGGDVVYYYTAECILNNQRESDIVQVNIE